jgi:hypothetical protein
MPSALAVGRYSSENRSARDGTGEPRCAAPGHSPQSGTLTTALTTALTTDAATSAGYDRSQRVTVDGKPPFGRTPQEPIEHGRTRQR